MIRTRTRKWGNSLGIVLPKKQAEKLRIGPDEEVFIELRKESPLREMYEANLPRITRKEFRRSRKESTVSKHW